MKTVPLYGCGKGVPLSPSMFLEQKQKVSISHGGSLPHWHTQGVIQFVTFRLADSLPQSRLAELNLMKDQWLAKHPQPWTSDDAAVYGEMFISRINRWLDAGYGQCILEKPEIRQIVIDSLHHFDGIRYALFDYVVMPNHVHMLILPYIGLDEIMHTIKSYTAKIINRRLGRQGTVWQHESFDHLIRSNKEFREKRDYILHNPDALPGKKLTAEL